METNHRGGISLPFIVFVIFLILKLTGNIDWSWWWITSPIWMPVALGFSLIIAIAIFYTIYQIFK